MPKSTQTQSMQAQSVIERFPHFAFPGLWQGAACFLLTAWLLTGAAAAHAQANQDWMPPGFDLQRADGTEFRYPDDLAGPTIILFWATWCPYCKALMPHLQSILDEYPGQLQVLALSIRDDGDPAARARRQASGPASKVFIRGIYFPARLDPIPPGEFLASTGFHDAVQLDFPALDQKLCLASRAHYARQFEKLIQTQGTLCFVHALPSG